MDQQTLDLTRRTLHGLAELVLAGPQYAASHNIRLQVTPGGFGTLAAPDLRVDGLELVGPGRRIPLAGTFTQLARAAGVEVRALRDVYAAGPEVKADDEVVVDPEATSVILESFARGDAAMRSFAPTDKPVLWPEHFDVAITLDEANYGVSPGDAQWHEPYAYVGPWQPRVGAFWNTTFGAARPMSQLGDAAAVGEFFREGAARVAADPPATT